VDRSAYVLMRDNKEKEKRKKKKKGGALKVASLPNNEDT
jgi:hypothetical protein